jgi:hypothetical protein
MCLFLAGALSGTAHAQAVATISGTIVDTSGGALVAAQVTIVNQDTALQRVVQTDEQGHYIAPLLPIGKYTVGIAASGFQKRETKDVTIEVGQNAVVDFTLAVASSASQVEVVAEAAPVQVQTTDAEISQLIQPAQVSELPLNGRDFAQLAWLGTGTVKQEKPGDFLNQGGSSEVTIRGSVGVSSQGMRENANDWLYDGVDDNEITAGGVGFLPSIDAIAEFRVMTYNFSAEYGLHAGTTVLVSSKSGTDQFHGTAFEFLRNNDLDAKDPFATVRGPYIQNEYGASLGGPLRKDKTFFFLDFQVNDYKQALADVNSVPTLLQREGIFTESFAGKAQPKIYDPTLPTVGGLRPAYANNTIPSGEINSIATTLINFLPLPNVNQSGVPDPNCTTDGAGCADVSNYLSDPAKTLNDNEWDARVDHTLGPNDHLFARFSWDDAVEFFPGGLPGWGTVGSGGNQTFHTHARNMALSETHIFSPTLINQITMGYNKDFNHIQSFGYGSNESQKLGIPGANLGSIETSDLTLFSISGFAGIGDRTFSPYQGGTSIYNPSDVVTWTHNQHALTFGIQWRANQENTIGDNAQSGSMSFSQAFTAQFTAANATTLSSSSGISVASFLLGYPASTARNNDIDGWVIGRRWKSLREFVQDTWTVNKSLTLNMGLAYSATTPITEAHNRFSNLDFATGQVFIGGTVGVQRDWGDVEPRIGFAWTPRNQSNFVVRGGYGIYHDVGASGGTTGPFENPPFANAFSYTSSNYITTTPTTWTINTGFPANNSPTDPYVYTGTWHAINPDFKQGVVEQWNFDVQRQLPGNILLTGIYAGTFGFRLSQKNFDVNSAPPNTLGSNPASLRPYPQYQAIDYTDSNGWLNYQSLQLKAEKRATHGLYLLAGYTYSKALTNGLKQEITGDPGTDYWPRLPYPNADKGLGSTDLRDNFTFSWIYQLPFGHGRAFGGGVNRMVNEVIGDWELNGITEIHTGPALGFSATNQAGTSIGDRPNLVPGCNPNVPNPSIHEWFNIACFSEPALGTQGTMRRTYLYGPGQVNFDASIAKNFQVTERVSAQLRSEFFNLFNHPEYGPPATSYSPSSLSNGFGTITTTVTEGRLVQFALKILF